jgi:two-component flavin-dependent monooxygenase
MLGVDRSRPPAHPRALAAARDTAAAHTVAADRERRLAGPVVDAIRAAGFARHFVPPAHGGSGAGFAAAVEGALTVASGCAAAGWCASLFAGHARMAGHLPVRARAEIWDGGPDVLIGAAVVPGGTAEAGPGGYVLRGRWRFVSGVDVADWVLLFAPDPDAAGELRVFAVPAGDVGVDDTWHTVGMRGTGSRTVVADGVTVPRHRTFRQRDLLAGSAPEPATPAHAVPFRMVNGLTLAAPAVGAARGGLAAWTGWISDRTEVVMGRTVRATDKGSVRDALARASAELDSAELLLRRIADAADAGGPWDAGLVARSHRDHAFAADLARSAMDRLARCCGTSGQQEDHPVGRFHRDVAAATSHAALQLETAAGVYAGHVLTGAG